jgi:hypothetical protein
VVPPRRILRELGLIESAKSGEAKALTTSVTEVVCTRVPLLPVIVSRWLPDEVEDEVVTLSVEEPGATTLDEGVKVEVAPPGRPLTESATLPLKPPLEPTETL